MAEASDRASELERAGRDVAALREAGIGEEVVVDLRQTHVSWLLFTEEHVYKIKKPVDLGFLDFTDPDRRRALCHEEVRLNRRLSPGVYLGVVRIRSDGTTFMAEPDDPDSQEAGGTIGFAVQMRRLSDEGWLSSRIAAGEIDRPLIHRVAHRIVSFQLLAERGREITRLGALESVREHVRQNFEQVEPQVGSVLSRATLDRVRAYSEAFMEVREAAFRTRERDGRICDGHGDLHTGNIHVDNGIDFIDCIEFDPAFRCGDVAAEIAFIAMDLDQLGRDDLADALVLETMARSGDLGLLEVLPFYKCYRAFTRGKVECMAAEQQLEGRGATRARAARYFDLAGRYVRIRRPLLLAIGGLMGTGKSTLAAGLADRLGAEVISSDVQRKVAAGLSPDSRVPEEWGQGIYDRRSTERTYARLQRLAYPLLRQGRSVILDASFARVGHRRAVRAMAADAGARFLAMETRVEPDHQTERLLARQASAGGASDGRVEIARAQRDSYEPPGELGDEELIAVDTSRPASETVAGATLETYRRILRIASAPRSRS